MSDNVHKGHRERMRKRFLAEGSESFADHELVEMLLYGAVHMKNTNDVAHALIAEFGSLQALLEADAEDIMTRCKVSESIAVSFALQKEFRRRLALTELGDKPVLNTVETAAKYAMSLLAHQNYERMYLICLDAKNRLCKTVLLSEGTVTETTLSPRMVVEKALKHQAVSVLLAHNHPGGTCRPSFSDLSNTATLRGILDSVGIRLADHIIVAGDTYFSFAAEGMLRGDQEK